MRKVPQFLLCIGILVSYFFITVVKLPDGGEEFFGS